MSYQRSSYLVGGSYTPPSRSSTYSRVLDYSARGLYRSGLSRSHSFTKSYSPSHYSPASDSFSSRRPFTNGTPVSSSPFLQSTYSSRTPEVSTRSYSSLHGSSKEGTASCDSLSGGQSPSSNESLASVQERLEKITCLEELQTLLNNSNNFDERRLIRAAIRHLRDKQEQETPAADMSSYGRYRSDRSYDRPSSYRSERTERYERPTSSTYRSSRSVVLSPAEDPKEERDYSLIQDESELKRLLSESDDYFEKKKIRAAMRELRKQKEESSGETSASSATYQRPRLSNRSKEEEEKQSSAGENVGEKPAATSSSTHEQRPRLSNRSQEEMEVNVTSTEEKVNEESDILNSSGDMSLMEKLPEHLERLRLKLEETKDLDKRREIRTAMRELRAQIREGKMKPNSREQFTKNKESTAVSDADSGDVEKADEKTAADEKSTADVEEKANVRRPETLAVVMKKEEDGSFLLENTQKLDDTVCSVKMRTKHSRTTSQSDVYEKSTTYTKEMCSPGGTKFIQKDDVVSKTKKSARGSMYHETDMTMKKMVRTVSGSEYAETDILIETASSSVSTGEKTQNSIEMKVTCEKDSDSALKSIDEGKELDLADNDDSESGRAKGRPLTTTLESSGYGSGEETETTHDSVFDSPVKERASPKIVSGLSDKSVYDGDTAVLEVAMTAVESDPSIMWYCNDKVLTSSKDFVQSFDGHVAKLVICEVFPDDAGCYKCVVKSGKYMLETSATLTVQENPNLTAPAFTMPLSDTQTQDGTSVTFTAEVKGEPQPIIKWYKEKKLLKKTADYQQSYDGSKATLVIDEVFPEDAGQYLCVATNEAGEVKSSCALIVTEKTSSVKAEKPKITSGLSDKTVTDGDKVILQCSVCGQPEPKIFWYKKDKLVKASEDFQMTYDGSLATLTISEVFPEDAGLYECVAENTAGEASTEMILSVQDAVKKVAPKFTKELADVTVINGEPATFECTVSGEPVPEIVWHYSGKAIEPSLDVRITFGGGLAKLELGEALLSRNAGQYQCCAKNAAGETTSTCSLLITADDQVDAVDGTEQKVEGDQAKKVTASITMATLSNLDSIEDEEALQKLLNDTSDFDERKKIRARIRALKDKKRQEREQERQKRESARQDEVKRKYKLAEEEKQARMKKFEELSKEKPIGTSGGFAETQIRQKYQQAEERKQKVLKEFEEKAAKDSIGKLDSKREEALQIKLQVAEGLKNDRLEIINKATTGVNINNNNTKSTSSTSFGGTTYAKTPESIADSIAKKLQDESRPGSSGSVTIKQESWSSKTGLKKTETTKTWGGNSSGRVGGIAALGQAKPQGARGAMAAFKQMDQAANPNASKPRFGGGVQRSASSIKDALLKWCQMMTKEYPLEITNFSTSWNDGMAFCALIHHFCPDAFDYSALNPKNREHNFQLAFDAAEKHADIAPLLEVEDMVRMKKPDWKCVFTYVQSFYRRFRNHESNKHTPIEQ